MEAIDIIYSDLYHKLWGKILNLKRIFIDQDNVKLHLCVFLKHVVIDWISSKCWPGGKTFCLSEKLMFTFVLFRVMKILWLWNFIDKIESYWSQFFVANRRCGFISESTIYFWHLQKKCQICPLSIKNIK